jgi:acyl-CoA synthetase (AMP-forming)/AMP-acid ligase II
MTLPTHIRDLVKLWSDRSPEHPALIETNGCWSYRKLDEVVAETEKWLQGLGIRAGDRVMIVGENSRCLVAVLLATTAIDAWPVLVNARLSQREIEAIRIHSGARRVLYLLNSSVHASNHLEKQGTMVEEREDLGPIAISSLNESAEPEPLSPDVAQRVAALIYTSGTTGLPKGVMLTHKNLIFMAAGSVQVRSVSSEDKVYGILPISHAVGLSVVLLGALLAGASLYLSANFDPMSARVMLENNQLTLLFGTPAIFNQWLQYAKMRKLSSLKFPALRIITSSGAPLDPVTKSGVENLFGMVLHNGYGVTECSPTIALTRPEAPSTDISVGPVFPGVEIQLLGSDHKPVPAGGVGELQVRGPNVMKGYYRAPEETAAAVDTEGWFNTRDLARLEDGSLFIVGRTKELIVHRGFNVYPAEVEAVLNDHPVVARSAVVGRAVDGDEEVIAFIQPRADAQLDLAELAEFAAQHLVAYKRPSHFVLLSALPTTVSGKIAKADLKTMAEKRFSTAVGSST